MAKMQTINHSKKSLPSKVVSFEYAASLVNDQDVLTVSASSGLNCPDKMLQALGDRFRNSGSPKDLTTIHPIAAGDLYGVDGIDHLAQPGLLKAVIAGSYPSGPSSKPMPKIWQMIVDNLIPAYNLPSGVLFDMHRDAAAGKPGVLTQVGMDTFVDPIQEGGAMNAKAKELPVVSRVNFQGEDWLHFHGINPTVAIIRATSADENGNLSFEHEGGTLGALDQALAVRNLGGIVIAQVKRVVANASLNPQQVQVPSNLVDYIVVDENQKQTTQTDYNPAISGLTRLPENQLDRLPLNLDKVIARRAARELKAGQTANLGFGISANVPRVLLENHQQHKVTWAIEQGAVGGVPMLGFQFGCAANPSAIIRSSDQFVYFQGGGFDQTFLSFLQIDQFGNVNVSRLSARPYLTAGCGGFVDIVHNAKRIVFSGYFTAGAKFQMNESGIGIQQEGKVNKLVKQVEQITFNGQRALKRGQQVIYVTERCVMELTTEGLMVTEVAPGVNLERDILAKADFPLLVSNTLKEMPKSMYGEVDFWELPK